jgi:hypothetical protein
MEESPEGQRSERRRRVEKPSMSKKKKILFSKMPEYQKREALIAIGEIKEDPKEMDGKVSFRVYAKAKKVNLRFHSAMLAFPSAKDVELATFKEWDEIFKRF